MDQAQPTLAPVETAEVALENLESAIASMTAAAAPLEELAPLHLRAAQIRLAQGASGRARALDHLWTCWRLRPDELEARLVLALCLDEEGKLEDLAELYRRSAERSDDLQEQNSLLLRAAELLVRAGQVSEALVTFQRLAEVAGFRVVEQRVRALTALERMLARSGPERRAERIETLALLVGHLKGEERFACASELAALQTEAGDLEGAHESRQLALVLRPAAPEVLEAELAYLEQRGEHAERARVLAGAVDAGRTPAERARRLRPLARLLEEQLGDPLQAVDLWWHAWEEEESGEEPAQLKRIYTALGDWSRYLQVLQRQVQRATEVDAKLEVYRELASFQREALHDELAAAETFGFILQLQPDDEEALAARVEIFERHGMEEAALAALRRRATRTRDAVRRKELLRDLARREARRAGRTDLVAALRLLDPESAEDRALVRELHGELDAEREPRLYVESGLLLVKMLRAGRGEEAESAALALDLARRCERAGDAGHAADCYRLVLEIDPAHQAARGYLESHGAEESLVDGGPEELAAAAERRAAEEPRRAVRLLLQAAQVARSRGGDGVALLRRAVALCPLDAAVELELCEAGLRAAGLHADAAELLRAIAERESQPARRKTALCALARLWRDELGDPARAVEALEDALALDPLDREVAEQIRALHAELGNHAALARVLEELLAMASGKARIPALEELGHLYAVELLDRSSALNRYGELLALAPDHREALAFCRAHDEASGDYRSIAVLLVRAAEATEDPLARAELHREIAEIAEQRLEDMDFAVAQWRRVVELCPADGAPRGELRRLLAKAGRWREVETALLSEVSRSLRPEEKVPLYLELAALARDRLGDEQTAGRYLRLALQVAPGSPEIFAQLEPVYEHLGLWRELAQTLRRHAEVEPDLEEKLKLLHRAARVLLVRLRREEEAIAVCRYVRELRPGDRVSATLMGEVFTRRGQWREKVALLREQIGEESDPTEVGRLNLELGHLLLERMGDSDAAAVHFERALELDGGRGEVLPLLRRLYEAQGRWDQLVDFIRRRASAETVSAPERAAALCEIGRIREHHQRDLKGAQEAYERAIHLHPECVPALTALRALALQQGQWREVVALGRRLLPLLEDPREGSRLLLEIATTLQDHLERPSAAAEALEEALGLDPENLRALERLARLSVEAEDWEKAARLFEQLLESSEALGDLHEVHYRLGVALERLGREDDAFSHYVKSFGREPMYLPTLDRLFELCYVRRQWDNTLRIASAVVSTYEDQKSSAELAELYLKIGLCELHLAQRELAVTRLQDMVLEPGDQPTSPTEAWVDVAESWAATALNAQLLGYVPPEVLGRVVKAMERTLVNQPEHVGALQVLAAIAAALKDWEREVRLLERVAGGLAGEAKQQSLHLVAAGDIAAHHLGAAQRAEGYYQRALEALPSSSRARARLDAIQEQASGVPTLPLPMITPAVEGTRRASPPPLPLPRPTRTQPISMRIVSPISLPPRPGDLGRRPPLPPAARPAPRSKPRKPGEDE